ncbi:MAG: hypothetical protein D3919_12460 [Candidatus Electrothrix sp. AW5]|nr:hypothetical protein [Candidatus Electrothrix gigas]
MLQNHFLLLQDDFLPLQNNFFLYFLLLQGNFRRCGKGFSRYSEEFSSYGMSFSCTESYLPLFHY